MPWIARDQTGSNPYRVFGEKPHKLQMVNWDGERIDEYTWSYRERDSYTKKWSETYKPLTNDENTVISAKDSPIEMEPGEGPYEIRLVSVETTPERSWTGQGI